jgi:hypothetical protein
MVTCNTAAIADWLIDGARSAEKSQDVLAAMCDRLVACGIPLWRAAAFARHCHTPLRSIGEFTLPGSSSAQTIYGRCRSA